MQFPESWLRSWVDPPLNREALAELLTMAGLEVESVEPISRELQGLAKALSIHEDYLFHVNITPNRGDCLSIKGLAREVSALTGVAYHSPSILPAKPEFETNIPVYLDVKTGCKNYVGRLIKAIHPHFSIPEWMQYRLTCCGILPSLTIVDIANYILLELGQPLHFFDAQNIKGAIHLRMAQSQEAFVTLQEKTVVLDRQTLVVADEIKTLAIAGVIGSLESAINISTNAIFIESALFEPIVLANKARQFGISSEAAYRFERGVDSALQEEAIERATFLLGQTVGGVVGSLVKASQRIPPRPPIVLHQEHLVKLLGVMIEPNEIAQILSRLALPFIQEDSIFTVDVPSFRFDLSIEEDLVEEIARLYGYERIPAVPTTSTLRMIRQPKERKDGMCFKRLLVHRGYQEVIHYPFVPEALEKAFAKGTTPISLLNPIDSQANLMRSTLLGTLVQTLKSNIHRQEPRVRLFEIAHVFNQTHGEHQYQEKLAILSWGPLYPESWANLKADGDFYDMKSDIEALVGSMPMEYRQTEHPALHQKRCAAIRVGEKTIGVLGELSPYLVEHYELSSAPILCEIAFEEIRSFSLQSVQFLSKFPLVKRDLAFMVDKACPAKSVLEAMLKKASSLIRRITLFDVYTGSGIPVGKKSMAYHVYLQAIDKTLTEQEIQVALDDLIEGAHEKHALLRC